MRSKARSQLADDFIHLDRRRLIAIPTANADEYIAQYLTWFEIGSQSPGIEVAEVLAVRGDRLVLSHMSIGYPEGPARETLALSQYSEELVHLEVLIAFDVDDLSAAMNELDRLASLLER